MKPINKEDRIEHGYDVDRVLWLGKQMEKTIGRRLRSEAVINGRTLKEGHMQFARPGISKRKEKLGEEPGQKFPEKWGPKPYCLRNTAQVDLEL